MKPALLELTAVSRQFPSGEDAVTVLNNINLKIAAGEMVALVGPSGSGKSTLMNILGCLDRPSSGSYHVAGHAVGDLPADALAQLRREHFGFIFQRYHLLPDLDAIGNVEIPAIYAGQAAAARKQRAHALLTRLGLGKRTHHRPGQLSGGQQQRVSIARSLMNGGQVILADEPTGALDRHSGQEVIRILQELHAEGHTVIIVTHDMHVAEYAQRIIEISDGEIVADRLRTIPPDEMAAAAATSTDPAAIELTQESSWRAAGASLIEACKMALLSMKSHRLRSFLTMLGIIIGIASVVSVVALGEGSRRQILKEISYLGTNTITIYPGKDYGDEKAAALRTLVAADADVLAQQVYADSATPGVAASATVRYRNRSASATLEGVGEQHFRVHGIQMAAGSGFTTASIRHQKQEAVIDHNTRQKLFGSDSNPIGQILMLGDIPIRIVGVAKKEQNSFGGGKLTLWVPYTTALHRIIGQSPLQSIVVRIGDTASPAAAEKSIVKLLTQRHGSKDFFIYNSDSIRKTIEKTTATLTLLVSMIALISLVVGGIGVMNIMLVSVTERIREIGVRMAVGARQADIMRQFLIEAILVCLLGGILGIALALGIGAVFSGINDNFQMHYSLASIVAACTCSTVIGIVFGFLPARNAARLDPVEALARE
ncbi:MacB family efflux pump subunit [Paraherbaspirillum soli]|uniref:Pyoverdine export ATP-binding/permease protein PvdT n=1 Tax=Paraherbaspirillum soli TaxID=631222 RepID=A0ABW0M9V6_9BURK